MEDKRTGGDMSFLQHLEMLRWHIIRSLISIVVFSVAAFVFSDYIFHEIIFGPSRSDFWTFKMLCNVGKYLSEYIPVDKDLTCLDVSINFQNRRLAGQFTMHITSSLVIGLLVAFPYTFWEIWRFVSPGLKNVERRSSRGAVFFVSILFFTGVLFGYYIVAPLSINFLVNYTVDPGIENIIDVSSYIGWLGGFVLANGLMFQLPVVAFFLAKAGLITPSFLRSKRRHAIVVVLVIAAIITPPDFFSQVLLAVPLMLLYELSILITAYVTKKRIKEMAFDASQLDKELEKEDKVV